MREVVDTREIDCRVLRSRVLEELFTLMGADVAEDTAVEFLFEEPVGAGFRLAHAMRAEADDADDFSDGALRDEIVRQHGAFVADAFGIIDHVFPAGGGDGFAGFVKLCKSRKWRLVREIVLSGVHAADAERAAVRGNVRCGDEFDV